MSKKSVTGRQVGRYTLLDAIASGGMATVHLGRSSGAAGFSKTVAIKRLHPQFAESSEVVSMLVDEARLVARITHPNVVPMLDVFADGSELYLVMEYVVGESLSRLLRIAHEREQLVPIPVATGIVAGALHGLHAAHEAKSETGESLGIVHRDVSPQNIMVGTDGLARVLDFGVAKARGRIQTTREGQVKGKLAYMAPEQVRLGTVTRRSDVFSSAVVLWETLTCRRLFLGENEGHTLSKLLESPIERPSRFVPEISAALDALVMKGLARDPEKRFENAKEFALALEREVGLAPAWEIGAWVEANAEESLGQRARVVDSAGKTPPESAARSERANEETAPDIDPGARDGGTAPSLSLNTPVRTRRGIRRSVVFGILGAAVLVAIGVFAFRPRSTQPVAANPETSPSPSPSTSPSTSMSTNAGVRLVLETKPSGARILLDGIDRGITPATLEVTRTDRARLELVLPGYDTHEESLRLDVAQRLVVTLDRERAPTRAAPRVAPSATAKVPKIRRFD